MSCTGIILSVLISEVSARGWYDDADNFVSEPYLGANSDQYGHFRDGKWIVAAAYKPWHHLENPRPPVDDKFLQYQEQNSMGWGSGFHESLGLPDARDHD